MRGRHRGTADGVGRGVTAVPRRGDVHARREDVHAGAEVGEGRPVVVDVGGAHGDRRRDPGRTEVAGIGVAVTGRDRVGHAGVDRVVDRVVEGGVDATAEAHVGHRRLDRVAGHPVDARGDLGGGTAAVAVEYPYADQLHALRHAVAGAADGTGDVRTVAVAVIRGTAVDLVDPAGGPATEVAVGEADPG